MGWPRKALFLSCVMEAFGAVSCSAWRTRAVLQQAQAIEALLNQPALPVELGAIAVQHASFQHRTLDQGASDPWTAIGAIAAGPMRVLEILLAQYLHVDLMPLRVRDSAILARIETVLVAFDAQAHAHAVPVFAFIGVVGVARGVAAQPVGNPIAEVPGEKLCLAGHHAQAGGAAA